MTCLISKRHAGHVMGTRNSLPLQEGLSPVLDAKWDLEICAGVAFGVLQESATDRKPSLPPTGRRSLHVQKHTCASCGYPAAKTRKCTLFAFPPTIRHQGGIWQPHTRAPRDRLLALLILLTTRTPTGKQTTGARRPSGERPRAPAACGTSAPFRASSRTASRRAPPRTRAVPTLPLPPRRREGGAGAVGTWGGGVDGFLFFVN